MTLAECETDVMDKCHNIVNQTKTKISKSTHRCTLHVVLEYSIEVTAEHNYIDK